MLLTICDCAGKPAESAKPGLSARNKRKMAMAKADRATQGDLLDAYKEKKPEEVPEDLPEPELAAEEPEAAQVRLLSMIRTWVAGNMNGPGDSAGVVHDLRLRCA